MILVADSGSTKTDWKLIDNNSIIETVHTEGINPFHQRKEDIENIITTSALTTMVENVQEVYFYGAGCNYPENIRTMQYAIRSVFRDARIAVEHDLLAASRALCGRSPGIACILGTGSNSCFFDGVNDEVATVKWPGEKQKDANKTLKAIVTVTAMML